MIPDSTEITRLWQVYNLPPYKQQHSRLVAQLAVWFAQELSKVDSTIHIDISLLEAAALLHDIDKMAPKRKGEHHPDAGVRILHEEGYHEIADIVRTHPLHAILDQSIAPKSWEERLLYLADKMVKLDIITVDKRFALWRAESLPPDALSVLDASYPLVKSLEREILSKIGKQPEEIASLANNG